MPSRAKMEERKKGPLTISKAMPAAKEVVSWEAHKESSQGGMGGPFNPTYFRAGGSGAQPQWLQGGALSWVRTVAPLPSFSCP